MSKINQYFDLLNKELFPYLDFKKINEVEVFEQVKEKLSESFKQVYGDYSVDFSDCENDDGFVIVPSVIETEKGKRYVGLVELSVEDSGEHYDTIFFTEIGIVYQRDLKEKGMTDVVPYTYKTLVEVVGDIHAESI